jgi:hypothetical protein
MEKKYYWMIGIVLLLIFLIIWVFSVDVFGPKGDQKLQYEGDVRKLVALEIVSEGNSVFADCVEEGMEITEIVEGWEVFCWIGEGKSVEVRMDYEGNVIGQPVYTGTTG